MIASHKNSGLVLLLNFLQRFYSVFFCMTTKGNIMFTVTAMGGQILMGQTMKGLEACDTGWKLIHEGVDATQQVLMVDEVISSAPSDRWFKD